jgi:hypothetical protein
MIVYVFFISSCSVSKDSAEFSSYFILYYNHYLLTLIHSENDIKHIYN